MRLLPSILKSLRKIELGNFLSMNNSANSHSPTKNKTDLDEYFYDTSDNKTGLDEFFWDDKQ